jgi:asparagine N-glycosylation enzyme membrane subunit Stt3
MAFVVWVLVGGFMAWRWPRLLRYHIPAVAVSAALALAGLDCPLTEVEKGLREAAGDVPYRGGFISHYLVEPVYAPGTTPTVRVVLRVATVAITVAANGGYHVMRHRRRTARAEVSADGRPG